jgi:ATP-binding cassette subfamily B protein
MQRLLFARPGLLTALIATSVATGLLESCIFALVAEVASTMAAGGKHLGNLGPFHLSTSISTMLAIAFAFAVLRLLLAVVVAYLPSQFGARAEAQIRSDLFEAFNGASWGVKSEELEGHFQDLMTMQINQVQQGLLCAAVFLSNVCTFAAFLVSALILSIPVALLIIVVAGLLFLVLRPFDKLGSRVNTKLSAAGLSYANSVTEAMHLAEETQVFGVGEAQRHRLESRIERARALTFQSAFVSRLVPGLYTSLTILVLLSGLLGLYLAGTARIATLGAVVLILVRSATYGQQAQFANNQVQIATPYLQRVESARARYVASKVSAGDRPLEDVRSLSLEHVSFAYRTGVDVLSDVEFEVTSREIVGIMGPSGAGKSTLVQLILRLREPTEGRLLVNGDTAADILRSDWSERVAYVPQDPRLLQATVAENIRYFRDMDDATVIQSAKLAHIHDEIVTWSQGYDTPIGQRADAVSGGQRQRLCLARALAGNPEILVLDEPTSSLDVQSETLVQESLHALGGRVMVFIVAHRLSTLTVCDKLLVLVQGRVEAFGPRTEVEHTNAFYLSASSLSGHSNVPSGPS